MGIPPQPPPLCGLTFIDWGYRPDLKQLYPCADSKGKKMDPGEEGDGGGGLDAVVAVAEVSGVVIYVQRITHCMLEGEDEPSQPLQAALKAQHHQETIRKFV